MKEANNNGLQRLGADWSDAVALLGCVCMELPNTYLIFITRNGYDRPIYMPKSRGHVQSSPRMHNQTHSNAKGKGQKGYI